MSKVPKWKARTYTDFQRGLLVGSILWVFAVMCYLGIYNVLRVWVEYVGIVGFGFFGFVVVFGVLVGLAVWFLNWLFRKLYVSRYRIFPGGD